MTDFLPPQRLLATFAAWVNRQQAQVARNLTVVDEGILHEMRYLILLIEEALRRALSVYAAHFHKERPQQGLGNNLISPGRRDNSPAGEIVETERLGGLLRSYHRAA